MAPVPTGFVSHVCPPGNADRRLATTAGIGFVCTTPFVPRTLLQRANWLCFADSAHRGPDRPAKLGLFRTIGLLNLPSTRYPSSPKFGFVLHVSPLTAWADCRNWLCSAELPCGRHPGRPRLGLFCIIGPGSQSEPGIGFVCTIGPQLPATRNWLCLTLHTSNLKLLLNWLCLYRQASGHIGFVSHKYSPRRHGEGNRRHVSPGIQNRLCDLCASVVSPCKLGCRASSCLLLPLSNHKSQFINHKSEVLRLGHSVPLSRGGVARIVTEFCARGDPESRVTPCVQRNKEFLVRGVFCLLNCCTNGTRRRGWRRQPGGRDSRA
jgi:hypothetical protein